MIKILASKKSELEKELRERVQAFFEANDKTPQSVYIEMALNESEQSMELSTIHILVKDS